MSKKDFIALADMIRNHNEIKRSIFGKNADRQMFNAEQIEALANYCQRSNPNFKRERWLDYIAGNCGKNGGKVQKAA